MVVDGWVDGVMGGRAGLRIANSNKKLSEKKFPKSEMCKSKICAERTARSKWSEIWKSIQRKRKKERKRKQEIINESGEGREQRKIERKKWCKRKEEKQRRRMKGSPWSNG